jgi:hypothetical protein
VIYIVHHPVTLARPALYSAPPLPAAWLKPKRVVLRSSDPRL